MLHAAEHSQEGRQPFHRRLFEERHRALRYESPLSLITVSLDGFAGETRNLLFQGMEQFTHRKRSSDYTGWFASDRIGLILPDTDTPEARKVEDRLRTSLLNIKGLNGSRKALDNGMISVMKPWRVQEERPRGENGKRWEPFPLNGRGPNDNLCLRLREERNRSDRSNKTFSVVLFSTREVEGGQAWQAILHSIEQFSRSSRLSDYWGWYDHDRLGLVLPETMEEGARRVTSRFMDYLRDSRSARFRKSCLREDFLSVLEYPKVLKKNVFFNLAGNDIHGSPQPETQGSDGRDREAAAHFEGDAAFCEQISSTGGRRGKPFVHRMEKASRRGLDLALIFCGALFVIPIMILVSLLVKFTSRGPVLFRQSRVGQHGVPFNFLKFRTMYHNCDQAVHREYATQFVRNEAEPQKKDGHEYYKLLNDKRITPLGAFLRKTALDELPQLINVIRGEMSLVGPRPPIDYEVEKYQTWQLRRVLEVKPGITGLWQVVGRSTTTFNEQVRLDLQYVQRQSVWMNLWLLFKTIKVVLMRKGGF
jgi:lipopolysaccharide/colanic/teichoic acid biosynthesis glycosyltransferase